MVPVRDANEIKELCQECIEHSKAKCGQFGNLNYYDGIRAAINWLFFKHTAHPLDATPRTPPVVIDGRDFNDGTTP